MGNNHSNNNTRDGGDMKQEESSKEATTEKDETQQRPPPTNFFEKVLKDIFQPPQAQQQQEPSVRPPKHMLWGCETPEEHYAKIKDTCSKAASLEGVDGLRALDFEFRMVHCPETCVCEGSLEFDNEGMMIDDSEEFMVPIGVPLEEATNSSQQPPHLERSMTELVESSIERLAHQDDMVDDNAFSPEVKSGIPKRGSHTSLFSLTTHYSSSTTASASMLPPTNISYHADIDNVCTLQLHHIPSDTLVTPENYQTYIANGAMYDAIARLCMQVAQTTMVEEGNLEWVSICEERDIQALVSKPTTSVSSNKILLIVTGKGQVRAGIFSRRHLLTSGMESSTALPLIREAVQRGMKVVMLDPNVKGHQMGMEVVEASLEKLFFDDGKHDEEIYVVAHSMAGAQLVRFLHKHECSSSSCASDGAKEEVVSESNGDAKQQQAVSDASFLRKIKAVAFTDSNHNINWCKDAPSVQNLLVGPSCLYVKSHKIHDEPKALGEQHHDCSFWKHRFGEIQTIWAGTHEHALTNYTARHHIWQHFDSFIHMKGDENDDDEFQTYYGAEGLIE